MGQLPRYYKLEHAEGLKLNLKIRKWDIPIILFNAMKNLKDFKWYRWLLYPHICIKAMISGMGSDG